MSGGETLQRLILDAKGEKSYARLSRDCGGNPSTNRLQALATGAVRAFPDADTIKGISRGLNVSVTRIVLAAARSLELSVNDSDPTELVLQGAGSLPAESRELLVSMSRQLQQAYATPWGETRDDVELAARVGDHGVDPEENQP
ncbi:hypothetical protein ASF21_12680 [Arthrobacter sp. Leaf234]|uniref:hypothetical protein n=1 Tax=Arthrobacter sp. Leaf234 TaxID=1736303 RepID=UPI0006F5490E|nr:hypothetical protein [Arthrobacter sp. Leaf234]KQN99657.1 hypothetical protein ASF21_12680 [Arthrobacter sp. Leaf234]